jgi:amino acid adenylation domain-containing protein
VTNTLVQGFRLSPQQARLRALAQAFPELPLGVACALRLRGALDRGALREALSGVAARHEILRTTFRAPPDGGPAVQVVGEPAEVELEYRDLAALPGRERAAIEAAAWRRATARGAGDAPPLRAALFRRGEEEHLLLLALPAPCADAPTLDALAAEAGAAYAELEGGGAGDAGAGEPFQYADYSEWLHETLASREAAAGRAFWGRRRVADAGILPELWPGTVPAGAAGTGVRHRVLGPRAARRLEAAASAHGAGAEAWLLAAWRVVLGRHAGDGAFAVGVAADGRALEEMRGSLGAFTRYLPLAGEVDGREPFSALVAATGGALREARAWQAFHAWPAPGGGAAPHPRFGFDHLGPAPRGGRWGGVEWRVERRWHQTERFDLRLAVEREPGGGEAGVRLSLYHDAAVVPAEGAARLLRRYAALLEATLADPDARAGALPLLDAAERAEALALPAASFPAGEPLHRLFERQAALTPVAVAVSCEGETLTYAGLDARANRLARHLRGRGVGPEVCVGLCMERGIDAVVGILGVLKAGGAYVPLDPAYPAERLAYVLEDAAVRVLLTQERLRDRIPASGVEVIAVDGEPGTIAELDGGVLPGGAGAESLAYVIYTSGSTGRPKGVQVTHANVARLFAATHAWFGFGGDDVWTLFHSLAFDFSVWELWGALLHGGRLVVVPFLTSRSPDRFRALLAREGVTVLSQTPSAFRQLIAADQAVAASADASADEWGDGSAGAPVDGSAGASVDGSADASADASAEGPDDGAADGPDTLALRWVVFGGEALEPAALRAWTDRHGDQRPRLVNMYGITETTVHVTWRPITRGDVERAGRSPVGVPIPDLAVYVADAGLQPVPVGVAGEMFVGGAGVARGYLGRPALTAQRFVPDPFGGVPGARLYRSGDRARRLPGGELEFLGRADEQVKIRGFRIEPGEIEAALLRHPAVAEAAVVAREDEPGEKRLAGYVVAAAGAEVTAAELRAHLASSLPEHMVPAAFVVLARMPLTPNGKLDRGALPAPAAGAGAGVEYVAPRTPTEEVLAAVWAEVLGVERVGIDDNFFAVGGDSILSVRVAARARERGVALEIAELFRHPSVRALAGRVAREAPEAAALEAVLRRERRPFDLIAEDDRRKLPDDAEDAYPLASLQAGMLFHQALSPDTPAYHNVDSYHLRGPFDEACFRRAVERATARQDNLRTSFHLAGFSEPLQVVHRRAEMVLRVEDVRHLDPAAQAEAVRACVERESRAWFDLARAPLLRLHVHLRADDRFQVTLTESHAINDGWSLTSLFADLFEDQAALLRGEPLPERPLPAVRFRDFVEMERAALASEESRRFWAGQLAGFTPGRFPRLPEPFRDPARTGTEARRVPLTPEAREGLQRLARSLAVPLKSVVLAAHLKVLALTTGTDDVVTGLSSNGRPEEAGGADVRGLFLNTVPLRVRLDGGSWRDLAREAFRAETGILPHRRYPLSALQAEHGPERITEASFTLVHFHALAEVLKGGTVEILEGTALGDTSYPLRAGVSRHPATGEILSFAVHCDTAAFTAGQVEALVERYRRVLEAMVADPGAPHARFFPLSAAERARVLEAWNATAAPFPDGLTLHALFEARARQAPDAPAVAGGGRSLAYGELDRRANRLAHALRERGVGPEVRVALHLEPSPALAVALLAVLKAGGAYVPLDTGSPPERLAWMLADSGARLVLAGPEGAGALPAGGPPVLAVCDDPFPGRPETPPEGGAEARGLAYVIYTSGSTGHPKGVGVEHRGVCNSATAFAAVYGIGAGSRVLLFAPLHFDASVLDVFTALLSGATLVVAPREALFPGPGLVELLRGERVTHLKITPSALAVTPPAPLPELEAVMVGGESCGAELVARWAPGRRFFNGYGATEHSVRCTAMRCEPAALPPPVGRPIANARLYVLDAHHLPAPEGVPGEVHMAGVGVARGYLERPGLTAERFLPDPFAAVAGARMYRSGDRGRWLPDGTLEFVGRVDFQMKVRGFRVEPGEVEAALLEHPALVDAVVVARGSAAEERRLAAFVVAGAGAQAPPAAELRAFLRARLPEYMVPGAFVALERLPLTPGGKVDRRALPASDAAGEEYVAPRTPTEAALAATWAGLLGVERVGVHDDFFGLGGHSLLAVRLLSRVREAFRAEVPLRALFEHPTLGAFARAVDGAAGSADPAPPLVAADPMDAVLAGVGDMPEEELDRLLAHLAAEAGEGA